jgi:hypothetical protein
MYKTLRALQESFFAFIMLMALEVLLFGSNGALEMAMYVMLFVISVNMVYWHIIPIIAGNEYTSLFTSRQLIHLRQSITFKSEIHISNITIAVPGIIKSLDSDAETRIVDTNNVVVISRYGKYRISLASTNSNHTLITIRRWPRDYYNIGWRWKVQWNWYRVYQRMKDNIDALKS